VELFAEGLEGPVSASCDVRPVRRPRSLAIGFGESSELKKPQFAVLLRAIPPRDDPVEGRAV